MSHTLIRRDRTCTGDSLWYVCSKGDYSGCCSVDPCKSGVCPDDEDTTTTTTASKTKATTTAATHSSATTTSHTISTTSQTTPTTSTTSNISSSTTTASETLSVTATATATSSPSSSPVSNSDNGNNYGAMVGGIIGAVTVIVAIVGLVFFLVHRSRRERGKRFNLLSWHNNNHQDERDEAEIAVSRILGCDKGANDRSPLKGSRYINYFSPSTIESRSFSPSRPPQYNARHTLKAPSTTLPPTDFDSKTHLMSNPTTITSITPTSSPERTSSKAQNISPIPLRSVPTPELPDTGFYRRRVELACHSQSELINIPLGQRQRQHQSQSAHPKLTWPSQNQNNQITLPPPQPPRSTNTPPIVTPDGIVLGANFDRFSPGYESVSPEKPGSGETSHVMSFMNYDSGSECGSYQSDGNGNGNGKGRLEFSTGSPSKKRKSVREKIRSRVMECSVPVWGLEGKK